MFVSAQTSTQTAQLPDDTYTLSNGDNKLPVSKEAAEKPDPDTMRKITPSAQAVANTNPMVPGQMPGGQVMLPPMSMAISRTAFKKDMLPLSGPAALDNVGPVIVLPPGLLNGMRPEDLLLGFGSLKGDLPQPNGFTHQGGEVMGLGGSYGRYRALTQGGGSTDNFSAYVAASTMKDPSWRKKVDNDDQRAYVDLGWRNESTELHLSTDVFSTYKSGGAVPKEVLEVDRAGYFAYPDHDDDKGYRISLSGKHELAENISLLGDIYVGRFQRESKRTKAVSLDSCGDLGLQGVDPNTLCSNHPAFGPNQLLDYQGNTIDAFGDPTGGNAYRYDLDTVTDSRGASIKLQNRNPLFGMANNFVVGLRYNGGNTTSSMTQWVGEFTSEAGFSDANGSAIVGLTNVDAESHYWSLYAADSLSVTPKLTVGLSGRYNYSTLKRSGTSNVAAYEINDDRTFESFNPAAGLTYNLSDNVTAYAGYSVESRAPTPNGMYCTDMESACALDLFFVADQALKQTSTQTLEVGLRGQRPAFGGQFAWNMRLFNRAAEDDFWFVQYDDRPMFTSIGDTRRRGIKLNGAWNYGRLTTSVGYTLMDARFQSAFTMSSPSNPQAVNREINVQPGDIMPGTPRHVVQLGIDYALTEKWKIGSTAVAASGVYVYGDEINTMEKTNPYVVTGLNTEYKVNNNVTLFAFAENIFDVDYETGGSFMLASQTYSPSLGRKATQDIGYMPGDPRTVFLGIDIRF
ncbi:TonB-dependent receptor [Pseudomonas putida]|nr:TonB-dependent receptor [Pseudomonas putida]